VEKKYVVRLSSEERERLNEVLSLKRLSRFSRTRAWIYLKADESADGPGWADARIAEAFEVSPRCVSRAREQLVKGGFGASLKKKSTPRPERRRLDGAKEARLIALACGPAPEGFARWTLKLLADRMVVLENDLEELSYETVRRVLKKRAKTPSEKVLVYPS